MAAAGAAGRSRAGGGRRHELLRELACRCQAFRNKEAQSMMSSAKTNCSCDACPSSMNHVAVQMSAPTTDGKASHRL